MPIHEYFCQVCGKFEFYHQGHDGILVYCPTCERPDIEKLISSGNFTIAGEHRVSLERPQDIEARKRNQANR